MVIEHPWRSFMVETKQPSTKTIFTAAGTVVCLARRAAVSGTLHCIQTVYWTMLVPELSQSQLRLRKLVGICLSCSESSSLIGSPRTAI